MEKKGWELCLCCFYMEPDNCGCHSESRMAFNEEYQKEKETQSKTALMNQSDFIQCPQLESIPQQNYSANDRSSNSLNHASSRKQSIAGAEQSRASSQQNPEKQEKKNKRKRCPKRNVNQNLRPIIEKVSKRFCKGNESSLKEVNSIIHKTQSNKSMREYIQKYSYLKKPKVMEEIVRRIHKSKIRDPKDKEATINHFYMLCELTNEQIDFLNLASKRSDEKILA